MEFPPRRVHCVWPVAPEGVWRAQHSTVTVHLPTAQASSILANCKACPELCAVVGTEAVAALGQALARSASVGAKVGVKAALRNLFTYLISAELGTVQRQCALLAVRLADIPPADRGRDDSLALRIYAQYPDDVGVFCIYLLNYVVLQPGEAAVALRYS